MPTIKLQQVKNFEKLLQYLETELGWPVEGREIDDIAFPFDLETDLGLDKKEVAKVRHVYRLKKMHKKQPFGIFFVDFEGKKMPVSVLKRILRTLALRRRANAKAADQLAWDVEDLIFISAVGEEKDASREISFAHFRKEPDNRHVLKVLAWDGGDTPLKMDHLDEVLHENLRFPDDVSDVEAWRKSWTAAFRTGVRQNIRRSEELAQALAALAMRINKEALSLIKKESANGPLKTLHAGFKDALIHDLTEEAFTDCYAQTITYGLLTAAITKVNQAGVKDLTSTSVLEMVPSTNPFLKDILSSFLEAGGRGQKGIDFDDLGVQDVIDLLRAESTDLPNILRDFGNLTQDEDPVIHFYETFLKIYNKDERVKRGAFYTPRPVVSYIVRSVDELLRKEFGLEDGLADTTTWGEMIKRNPAIKLPPLTDTPGEKKTIKETEPFVQILDPATGTATFLVEVINIIEKTVKAKAWTKLKKGVYDHDQHSKREEVLKAWNEYVPEYLLKRLHAYEIMMAPYVIAHMKVGLKLAETGYQFATEERARIYLTNALEPKKDFKERLNFDIPALAIEARQVNEVKNHNRFTVIVGNPPYSGHSSNPTRKEDGELTYAGELLDRYFHFDGKPLGEKQPKWLHDDYVKFTRLGESLLCLSGIGILGFITNHGFIKNPTFRGMRESLLSTFGHLWLLDLGGSAKKKIRGTQDIDENVFDIEQGTAITVGVVGCNKVSSETYHASMHGTRGSKYNSLLGSSVASTAFSHVEARRPYLLLSPSESNHDAEWYGLMSLAEVMPLNALGVVSGRDDFAIGFDREALREKLDFFCDPNNSDSSVAARFSIKDAGGYILSKRRKHVLGKPASSFIKSINYRPFDTRLVAYSRGFLTADQNNIMKHLGYKASIAIATTRSVETGDFSHIFCTRVMMGHHFVSLKESNYAFPLYLQPGNEEDCLVLETKPVANISPAYIKKLKGVFQSGESGPGTLPAGISPEDIFNHAYAVIHSPAYRMRYAEFLRTDFPRIPITARRELFRDLARLGSELVSLHLLEAHQLQTPIARFSGPRNSFVDKVSWSNGTVWINNEQSIGFIGVSELVWCFRIGGYQVCKKWLDDRRKAGRALTDDDILHYLKVITALSETIRLMSDIDAAIELNGGWPKAFQ